MRDSRAKPVVVGIVLAVAAVLVALASRQIRADDAPAGRVSVPNVVGMTSPSAEAELVHRGLRWRFEGLERVHAGLSHGPNVTVEPFDSDLVIGQEPNAGSMVGHGSIVVLDTRCLELARQGDRVCQ